MNTTYGGSKYNSIQILTPFLPLPLGGFERAGCSEYRCHLTSNRSYLGKDGVDKFSAILFHQRSLSLKDLPGLRDPTQFYVHWSMESPVHTFYDITDLKYLRNFFNLTMTYRLDSDISLPYGSIEQVRPLPDNLESFIQDFGEKNRHLALKERRNSTKAHAAWFVSNCRSFSGREELVKKLKSYIGIDIFGSKFCSNLRCSSQDNAKCLQMMNMTYKFYLSLENSLCKDYVTEKFWKILPYNVIPIVLNGVDMTTIAPYHSYIDVKQFSSFQDFAEHIVSVSQNDSLFASYFWWRDFYQARPCDHGITCHGSSFTDAYCKLCAKLHHQPAETKVMTDIKAWWTDGACNSTKLASR